MNDDILPLDIEIKEESIIKVMGVGGGGCNAVDHMYKEGIRGVTFLVCNTDKMCLNGCSVPAKLQLGPGWGAGGKPETARQYAEESREKIHQALDDGTQMVFLTAGMGGGTGTGATAIIAEEAQKMNILTVGIVTIPFAFEGKPKIRKALTGVATLAEHVDAILVINNEKLKQIYPDLDLINAFKKSDDVVGNAAKSIAEIITVPGYINTDFADVNNTLQHGKVAIMNVGQASGENRVTEAINNALHSPLVNSNDVHGAKRVLMQFYCSTQYAIKAQETDQIHEFVREVGEEVEVQWGITLDETMGEEVRVTLIATGYEVSDIPSLNEDDGQPTVEDAMRNNYDNIDKPIVEPKEDEPKQEIELQIPDPIEITTPAPEQVSTPRSRPASELDDDIKVCFDEDEEEAQPASAPAQPEKHSILPGWMRNRK